MTHNVHRERVSDLMGSYYDSPSRNAASPRSQAVTPDICSQDIMRMTGMELKIMRDKLRRQIESTKEKRNDIYYREFLLLSSCTNHKQISAFLDQFYSKDLSLILEGAISDESEIVNRIGNHFTTARTASEMSAAHELFKLVDFCENMKFPECGTHSEVLESVKAIKSILLDCPSSLRSYPLIERSLKKLEDQIETLFKSTVERIAVNFEAFSKHRSELLRELMSIGSCDSSLISNNVNRILISHEEFVNSKLNAVAVDKAASLQLALEMRDDSLEELHWTFPNNGKLIDELQYRLRHRIIPSWIFHNCVVDIAEFTHLHQSYSRLFPSDTQPSFLDVVAASMRLSIWPVVEKYKGDSQHETLILLGSTCADLLSVQPREKLVLLFESVTIELLVEVAKQPGTTREAIYSLIELQSQFQLRTIPNLLRMVSVEMIADIDERELDTRLEQLLSQVE